MQNQSFLIKEFLNRQKMYTELRLRLSNKRVFKKHPNINHRKVRSGLHSLLLTTIPDINLNIRNTQTLQFFQSIQVMRINANTQVSFCPTLVAH